MKNLFVLCLCVSLFALGASSAQAKSNAVDAGKTAVAQDAAKGVVGGGNPIEQLTGDIWMKSSNEIKAALLYGVECALYVEHAVAKRLEELDKAAKKKKAPSTTLSPFEKGWAQAFVGVPRAEIVENIDTWYAENPDKLQRPVFEVIWYELIEPKIQSKTK